MKIQTKITEMFGVDLPIVGAPMFLVSYPDLVVSVCEAGGIGCFPAPNYRTISELKDGIAEIQARTKLPFGVNILLFTRYNPDWRKQLEACLENKVKLIIASLGTPRTVISEIKSAGAKIFCDITTLKHAKLAAKVGVDGLIPIAQGAGGHAGAISPFSLIPYIQKEIGLPIIGAGSIGNGRQMAAAMALGADAVYVGTRLIATHEAAASAEYKKMLIEAIPEDIEYTDRISGIPANWLKQSLAKADQAAITAADSNNDRSQKQKWKNIYSAGHGVAQIQTVEPAKEVIQNIAKEYVQTAQKLPQPV